VNNLGDETDINSPLGVGGNYKHVFIDLDDTIWDFHGNARAVLQEIYEEQGLSEYFKDFDEYFRIYAKRNLELWELYGKGEITKEFLNVERFRHPLLHVGVDNLILAKETGIQFLDMLPNKTLLIPFAKELLEYLSAKYRLTVVSNGFIEVQYKKLRNSNLEHYFTHVVLSEAAKALKPDKRIFEYALQLNNANAAETIMIGDSYEADIVGARNAGIDQIYFKPNISLSELNNQATFQVTELEKILSIL
jgi:putative hydrolase of the HAD superfamily